MKRTNRMLLLAFCGMLIVGSENLSNEAAAANKAATKDKEYSLLPQPRRIDYPGGVHILQPDRFIWLDMNYVDQLRHTALIVQDSLAKVGPRWELTTAQGKNPGRLAVTIQIDPSQVAQPQGYKLTIGADQICIVAHDGAGAFYAGQTLKQIFRQAGWTGQLACAVIDDWPDFPNRGVLLDVSRDKVPKMETLYNLVDLLSELKINQLQLYTEHTFAYREHREVWKNASPMTGEQILALDAYCLERFVELVPNQNSFGHMGRWLVHQRYLRMAEVPGDYEAIKARGGGGHFSLCPVDPESIEFVAGLFDELLPHFSSRHFNVCCDETSDLGKGRSKTACEERGVGRVYLEFLLKIHEQVKKHGRTMMMWGDIVNKHPELINELPKDIIALEWGYSKDHPFDKNCQRYAAHGVSFYVCPGVSTWNSIMSMTENALGNLWNAAENGLKHGAIGYLNTDWGDNGHWQPPLASYPGYAYGAAVSWAAKANQKIDLPRMLSLHVYRDMSRSMGRLVYDLGNAYKETDVFYHHWYRSAIGYILRYPAISITRWPYKELKVEKLESTLRYIDNVMSRMPRVRMQKADAKVIRNETCNAAAMLRHACRLAIARLQAKDGLISNIPEKTRQELAQDIKRIISEHKRLWRLRNREGGLVESAGRLEKLAAMYSGLTGDVGNERQAAKEVIYIKPHHFIEVLEFCAAGTTTFKPSRMCHASHIFTPKILADPDILLQIELGVDDLCGKCIFDFDGICVDVINTTDRTRFKPGTPCMKGEYNMLLDRRWCKRLGIKQGDKLTAREFCELLLRCGLDDITDIYCNIPAERIAKKAGVIKEGIRKYLK
jgi:hexosaminidase